MKIGIIGAMDVEVEHLKAELADARTERVAGTDFCSGRLGEKDVVVVKCGIGKVNAGICAQVLADLGIKSMRLLTNNPAKRAGLEGYGLTIVGRVALPVSANPENLKYLTTKRDRMGHELDGLDALYGEGHA